MNRSKTDIAPSVSLGFIMINLFFLVLLGCAATKTTSQPVVTSEPKQVIKEIIVLPDTIPPPVFKIDTIIKVSHGTCYGNCAAFSYSIFNDGTVIWNGIKNTARMGWNVSRLSQSQISEISNMLNAPDLRKLFEYYPPNISETVADFPNFNYKLFINNSIKTVKVNNSGPAILKTIDNKILDWLEVSNWIKIQQ